MLTDFQCNICHFRNMQDRSIEGVNQKNQTLLVKISKSLLDKLWRQEPGTIKGNIYMLSQITVICQRELGLVEWIPPLGPYPMKDEVGVVIACVTLRLLLWKGRYV